MLLTKKVFKNFLITYFYIGKSSDYSRFNHLLGELIGLSIVILMHMSYYSEIDRYKAKLATGKGTWDKFWRKPDRLPGVLSQWSLTGCASFVQ